MKKDISNHQSHQVNLFTLRPKKKKKKKELKKPHQHMVIAQMQLQVLLLKCCYKRLSTKGVFQEQPSMEFHTCCLNVFRSARFKKLLKGNLIVHKERLKSN